MISKREKESILLSAYVYANTIDDEEVTLDGLLQFIGVDGADIVLSDFMVFAGQEEATLDSVSLQEFANSFDNQEELFTTIDSFCDAKHEPHVVHHANGSTSRVCRYKKGAVHERESFKERLGRAKQKNRIVSELTKAKIRKGLEKYHKKHKHKG